MTGEIEAPTQQKYEVRFDWGGAGLARIARDAGVIVLIDALALRPGPRLISAAAAFGVPVLQGSLRNRTAVARWVLDHQERLGARARVALVAAVRPPGGGSPGFWVENQLAAGAVIDALAELGVDYSSPEAAAACASFTGLKRAVGHLLTASVGGQRLIEQGERDAVERAAEVDASDEVPLLARRA